MAGIFLDRFPYNDVLIVLEGEHRGKATDEFAKFAESLEQQVVASPVAPQPADVVTGIVASGSGTLGGFQTAGLYQVSVYREVTVEDPVSSSLAVTLTWTHNGKSLQRTLGAFGGAPQQDTDTASDVTVIEIDPGSAIGYTYVYASNTPGLAQFSLSLIAELMQTIA